ncbi:hypothetical protein M011DRAFT_396005 [Sporormia fimetaria CBS 119925]|uniref:BAH-domain-containing protein n=1 Tax=Sporormia fimetaria CBS 119925 TaxID=1340428 RepID=A0A6A6VLL5_9PLEO|nr:hypothetical protein M011DRAFT_396005 [Sporormia fimetaria CBS 119925]
MVEARNGGGEPSSFRAINQTNPDTGRGGDGVQHSTSKSSTPKAGKRGAADDAVHSKAVSRASSRRNSTQAVAASDLRQSQSTHSTPLPDQAEQDGSEKDLKDPKEPKRSKSPAPAPYGTRSRNRPGTSRINYAEDVDMEFDMSQSAGTANAPGLHQSRPPTTATTADGGLSSGAPANGHGGARRGGTNAQSNAWGTSATPKHHQPPSFPPQPPPAPSTTGIPGTSTFAANPSTGSANPPKRRKNATSQAANASQTTSAAPSHGGARRGQHHQHQLATPAANCTRESTMMTFEKTGGHLVNGHLEADDGQTVSVNDQVYLVCEPPGEPYYLCRIMEFIHVNGDPNARVEALRVNWFYRPRDVQRFTNDTRLVYATMHSDICPITSLRGRCQILHRSEIDDLDEYRKQRDSFWFNQVFDRFIHRWYEVIPTSQVINVPAKVKKALDEQWKYICLETSRVKELTSASKSCKRCAEFCATNDLVECAYCRNTWHINCIRPPLPKKPTRGFAWTCGPCYRAQERKRQARVGNDDGEEEEQYEEEEEEPVPETTAPSPNGSGPEGEDQPGTQAELAIAKMWPMRYLGIHCRVEDALQYDDRAIYPRASSRLGPRHQANVPDWPGRPLELVKPAEIKKRYVKSSSHKKDAKLTKETLAAIEADKAEKAKRPKWVQDEPPGYVRRGEDYPNKDSRCTAELMFKMPPLGVHSPRGQDDTPTVTEEQVEAYMTRAKALAKDVGVPPYCTNFLDKCLALFAKHGYDADAALKQVKKLDRRKDLHEPELTKEEEKKWNEGVAKYGSEIRSVRMHVKTITHADAVRYYYMWKKTPKGREIWGSYSNRKGRNKKAAETETRLVDDVADDQDDSAFDAEKAATRKRGFQCKFCSTRHSRRWRRAPGVSPGQTVAADGRASKPNSTGFVLALCQRCANLWRKYAVTWENTDEIAKKVAQGGGKAWKRRFDEELLREVFAATAEGNSSNGTPAYGEMGPTVAIHQSEPPKKKQKTGAAGPDSGTSTPAHESAPKKKEKEKLAPPPPKAPTPPPVPAKPRLRILPCAVCRQIEGNRLECATCRLTVHKSCYGVDEVRQTKWFCDTCKNDKIASVSHNYECVLCPHKATEMDLYEPPKVSHKKKTDREREKERMERDLVEKAREEYRQSQLSKGRPVFPREPLKRTADNNWVHVQCALWVPEIKFTDPQRLEKVEGVGAPTLRYDAVCKICKTSKGACVPCLQCHANFHVGCAHAAGYTFGFDITPVKATRRDVVPTVTINGETGSMTAAIWCKEHSPKTVIHPMNEEVEGTELVALQLFASKFKRADPTLTGTARKANLVDQSTRAVPQMAVLHQGNRRTSTVTNGASVSGRGRQSNAGFEAMQAVSNGTAVVKSIRRCERCNIDSSPQWWASDELAPPQHQEARRESNGTANNGLEVNGHGHPDSHSTTRVPNGLCDHTFTGIRSSVPVEHEGDVDRDGDTLMAGTISYLCQKCHWKKLNAPESLEREKSQPAVKPDPQPLPMRSPPLQPPSLPPPSTSSAWLPSVVQPSLTLPPPPHLPQHAHPGPPLGMWPHNGHPPPGPLLNGVGHAPPAAPMGHPSAYPTPYGPMHQHQPNAYQPYSGPPVGIAAYAPLRDHYVYPSQAPLPGGAPPPPLHIGYPHAHPPPRPTEPPYVGLPPAQAYSVGQGSPTSQPHGNRSATPRDSIVRDAPNPVPPIERPTTGASASPSLRNLLH